MPRMRAFDFPAARLTPGMDHRIRWAPAFRGNVPGIAFTQEHPAHRGIVKSRIQTQMVRMRTVRLWTDNGHGGQNGPEHRPLIHIGRRAHHAQGDATPIDQQMLFIAGLGTIGRIWSRFFFPPWGRAQRSHPRPAIPTRSRACHHTDVDTAPRSAQRPRPASIPQTDHRPFARDRRLLAVRRATDTRSTRRAASHRVTCDRWHDGAHLWHATAAPVRAVRVRSKVHRALGVVLT